MHAGDSKLRDKMDILEQLYNTARAKCPHIVLSEGDDPRVVEAAVRAAKDGLAQITLLGTTPAEGVRSVSPATSDRLSDYSHALYELRKAKGMTPEAAAETMRDPLAYAAMMVRQGHADGTIGGAVATTAATVRAALQIIGKAPEAEVVSSYFLMLLPAPLNRPVIFADCGLILHPSAEELASIAIASAQSLRALTGLDPKVAMLSFSTKGSVPARAHESLGRMQEACALLASNAPDLPVDGELQFDAAIVPEVAQAKAPGSAIEGAANVLVFPDLNAGNIGYKIAQRIGGAVALGPILQGLAKPANDLSRGCSVQDVYTMIAITAAQVR